MKKVFVILMSVCLLASCASVQGNKALEKALKKEYKTKKKEFEKGGWKLYGSSRTFEVALLKHYDKLHNMDEDGFEVVGVATKFKSKNVGRQMAANNAAVTYASMATTVKGRIISDLAGDGVEVGTEFEHFYAAFESQVEKEIRNVLQESFALIREHADEDGTYEMQIFYIVSEAAASRARIRALETAAKESEAAQKYAKKVADFVKDGFKE